MFTVTRYCLQPYENRHGAMVRGEPLQFRYEEDARSAAQLMARRVAFVKLYAVTGEPVQDLWRKPVLIDVYGDQRGTQRCLAS